VQEHLTAFALDFMQIHFSVQYLVNFVSGIVELELRTVGGERAAA
jgi:hypothetical protein